MSIKGLKVYKRLTAYVLAGTMLLTMSGCSKKENNADANISANIYTNVDTTDTSSIITTVDNTSNKLGLLLPQVSEEIKDNAAIMLLLDVIAKEDENGKISADLISEVKAKIDSDDMISEFSSFLDILGYKAIKEGKVEKISSVLPEELNNDKLILSNIETILENIIKHSNEGNKNNVISEFNKIYTLFVEEKEIEVDGTKFEIRDLSYTSRAVATTYAEVAAYYSRNYISKDKYEKIDKRTNDQNNKAYIKEKLEILDNQMEEKSEVDVIALFDKKYIEVSNLLNGKVSLSEETIKNLVNYINLKYLDGDKVATKDMNQIVGEYEDEKVNDVMTAIEAINTYNLNNQNSIIPFSVLLVDEHLKTETGKTDKIALDFAQYNSIMLNNTTDEQVDYLTLSNNPYFTNIYKYFTKQNFTHIQSGENGENINNDIAWQEISDGVNFVNYQVILFTLNKYPEVKNIDNYIDKTETNLGESIQYIQNTIMEECKKIESTEYIKTK